MKRFIGNTKEPLYYEWNNTTYMRAPQMGLLEMLRMATLFGIAEMPHWLARNKQVAATTEAQRNLEAGAIEASLLPSICNAVSAQGIQLKYGCVQLNTVGRQRDAKEIATSSFASQSPQVLNSAKSLLHDVKTHLDRYVHMACLPVCYVDANGDKVEATDKDINLALQYPCGGDAPAVPEDYRFHARTAAKTKFEEELPPLAHIEVGASLLRWVAVALVRVKLRFSLCPLLKQFCFAGFREAV